MTASRFSRFITVLTLMGLTAFSTISYAQFQSEIPQKLDSREQLEIVTVQQKFEIKQQDGTIQEFTVIIDAVPAESKAEADSAIQWLQSQIDKYKNDQDADPVSLAIINGNNDAKSAHDLSTRFEKLNDGQIITKTLTHEEAAILNKRSKIFESCEECAIDTAINETLIDKLSKYPRLYNYTMASVRVIGVGGMSYAAFAYQDLPFNTALIASLSGAVSSGTIQLMGTKYSALMTDSSAITKMFKFAYKKEMQLFSRSQEQIDNSLKKFDQSKLAIKLNKMKATNAFGVWFALENLFLAPILMIAYDYTSPVSFASALVYSSFVATLGQGFFDMTISEMRKQKIHKILEELTPGYSATLNSLPESEQEEFYKDQVAYLMVSKNALTPSQQKATSKIRRLNFYTNAQILTVSLFSNFAILLSAGPQDASQTVLGSYLVGGLIAAGAPLYFSTRYRYDQEFKLKVTQKWGDLKNACKRLLSRETKKTPDQSSLNRQSLNKSSLNKNIDSFRKAS